jgi:hypothetical protein
MLQVLHLNVSKVDRVLHLSPRFLLPRLGVSDSSSWRRLGIRRPLPFSILVTFGVAWVSYGFFFQVFHIDVSSVSSVFRCILQVLHLNVSKVDWETVCGHWRPDASKPVLSKQSKPFEAIFLMNLGLCKKKTKSVADDFFCFRVILNSEQVSQLIESHCCAS